MEHLYHYTNLNALSLILKNKTFRLSSLKNMDDLEEGVTADLKDFGRFIYISSWTNNSDESLLLWNYSRGSAGIRIKMIKNPFETEKVKEKTDIHGINVDVNDEFNVGLLDLMKKEKVTFFPPRAELIGVTYTEVERLLKPAIMKRTPDGNYFIETQNLGIFKRLEWRDQQEYRYRLQSVPIGADEVYLLFDYSGREKLLKIMRNRQDLNTIDLPLRDDAFDDLEILCSPYMSDDDQEELYSLLKKYAPNTKVKYSKLQIRS